MTIPAERTRAVQTAEDFLGDLLCPSVTPKVPLKIRERARRILRHFPGEYDIARSADKLPDVWGPP